MSTFFARALPIQKVYILANTLCRNNKKAQHIAGPLSKAYVNPTYENQSSLIRERS